MTEILNFIFPNGVTDELTPVALICIFVFMLTMECVSAIIGEVMKGAGLK